MSLSGDAIVEGGDGGIILYFVLLTYFSLVSLAEKHIQNEENHNDNSYSLSPCLGSLHLIYIFDLFISISSFHFVSTAFQYVVLNLLQVSGSEADKILRGHNKRNVH